MDYLLMAELITCVWVAVCFAYTVRLIGRGMRDSLLFVALMFFATYGAPLFLDLALRMPEYEQQPMFYYAAQDITTRFLYCLFLWTTPLIWFLFLKRRAAQSGRGERGIRTGRLEYIFLGLMMALPLILVILAPSPAMYLHYAQIALAQNASQETLRYHSIVAAACLGSIIAAAGVVTTANDWRLGLLATSPFVVLANFSFGKRSSVALSGVLLLYVLWQRRAMSGMRLKAVVLLTAIGIGIFSYAYQGAVRHVGTRERTAQQYYDDVRVDFGRDSRVQAAIYAELNPTYRILEYRGESLLFVVVAFIPRGWWPDKPYPYAVYFTSVMLGRRETADLGWGVTTSFLDEAIANFSWCGFLVGPILIALFCRRGDSFDHPFIRLLTAIIGTLLLALQIPAFFPVLALWACFVLLEKLRTLRAVHQLRMEQMSCRHPHLFSAPSQRGDVPVQL